MATPSLQARLGARPLAWLRERHQHASRPGSVCYFPPFRDHQELTSHYHRARWYLPEVDGTCQQVTLPTAAALQPGPPPAEFCSDAGTGEHIDVAAMRIAGALRAAWRSRLVLVWKKSAVARLLLGLRRFGFPVVDVQTDDPEAVEYGAYCSLLWKHLTPGKQRFALRQENQRRFAEIAERLRRTEYDRACVFGTGPTLEQARELDFSGCLTIACNSIVQNPELLEHLDPRFIAAGDVVSHFGVSAYAGQFRADLACTLQRRDCWFVATDSFGYLLTLNHPEIAERTILVPQTCDGPNYDLVADFAAPKLDSVLNILMLPLAATFCDAIYLLGCDGKIPKRDNEDFWAHARGAQYHDLVDTGRTGRIVRELLPEPHFATVYAKPAGRAVVDTFVTEVSQDTWILFPWDQGPQFVQPIVAMREPR